MFSLFSSKEKRETKPAGPAWFILNTLRVCNIISLLDVAVASWIMLIMTVKTSNFFFFDGFSHFITSTVAIFLILSELALFKPFFTRSWPILGPRSSFLFLGSTMVALGFNVLGNLNKEATSVAELGLPMWRVVISSGILSSVFGFFAIFANFWYRDTKNNISVRSVRSRYIDSETQTLPTSHLRPLSISSPNMTRREKFMSKLPFNSNKRFPVISGPYHTEVYDEEKLSRSNTNTTSSIGKNSYRGGQKDYGYPRSQQPEVVEDRVSPVAAGMLRPPTALHPLHRRGGGGDNDDDDDDDVNRYSASNYSVATHVPYI